LQNSLLKALE